MTELALHQLPFLLCLLLWHVSQLWLCLFFSFFVFKNHYLKFTVTYCFQDCSGPEDDSEEESLNEALLCEKPNKSCDFENALSAEGSSHDSNKNMLMSSLELESSAQAESRSKNLVSTSVQRPVFNCKHSLIMQWRKLFSLSMLDAFHVLNGLFFSGNDESMWKAMSQHPLFSKYMEVCGYCHPFRDVEKERVACWSW